MYCSIYYDPQLFATRSPGAELCWLKDGPELFSLVLGQGCPGARAWKFQHRQDRLILYSAHLFENLASLIVSLDPIYFTSSFY